MYKLIENGVINLDTGAFIPEHKDNSDWVKYQAWLKNGNSPFGIDTPIENINGEWVDISITEEYKAEQKSLKIEALTEKYSRDKSERMVSWVTTFVNGLTSATTIDEVKSKANAFKSKLVTLQNEYLTNCQEVENG